MTIIWFIVVLGITILIHEFGHYILAKRNGVYVYEFSFGMGPRLFKMKKNETEYSIRLFPIGGYVSMAGEDLEDKKIPKEKQLINKSWFARLSVMIAGILFNFALAIIFLFIIALITGSSDMKPVIESIEGSYPISLTDIKNGDVITRINGTKIKTTDDLLLELQINSGNNIQIEVNNENIYNIIPVYDNESEKYVYGFTLKNQVNYGVISSIKYAFNKTFSLVKQMLLIIIYLISGKLSLSNLSGPIGIYTVVDAVSKTGILNIMYLIAYLCINVGFINFLPLPAFDGGRILFLLIEKIKGSKVNRNVENSIHSIGFLLLMILMVIVTFSDIIKLFNP